MRRPSPALAQPYRSRTPPCPPTPPSSTTGSALFHDKRSRQKRGAHAPRVLFFAPRGKLKTLRRSRTSFLGARHQQTRRLAAGRFRTFLKCGCAGLFQVVGGAPTTTRGARVLPARSFGKISTQRPCFFVPIGKSLVGLQRDSSFRRWAPWRAAGGMASSCGLLRKGPAKKRGCHAGSAMVPSAAYSNSLLMGYNSIPGAPRRVDTG